MRWQSRSFKYYSNIFSGAAKWSKQAELWTLHHNSIWCHSLHVNVCRMSQRPERRPWVTSKRGTICQSSLFSCYWGLLDKHYITGLIIPRMLRRQKSIPLWPPGQRSCWLTQQLLHQTGLFSFLFFFSTSVLSQLASAGLCFLVVNLCPTYFSCSLMSTA